MIKACLFDLTCILVSPSKNRMVGEAISERNDPQDLAAISKTVGGSNPAEQRERMQNRVRTFWEYDSRQMPDMILPGALDFIKDLYRHGIKLASTSTDCRADSVLSSVGLYSMFSYIVDPESVAERPDPEALLKAANHLGLKPEECIAFENSPEGLEAAKKAGMRCVAVGDLSELYKANMGVTDVKGLTLLKLKDGLETPAHQC